jgi:hypothetical protein
MIVVGLVQEILGILTQLLGNFVAISVPAVTYAAPGDAWGHTQYDGELILTTTTPQTTAKGNALTGAIADIVTSGAQLVDLLLQTLVGFAPEWPVNQAAF